jgi:hypothetical protein
MTYLFLLWSALRASLRYRQHLVLENLALRQQLAVLSRQSRRPKLQPADRLFWSFLSRLWSRWRSAVVLVQPETVIRWQRTAWRRYWAWRSRHGRAPGRSPVPREIRELIVRLTRENPRWGSMRIVGELGKLGYDVSSRTVRRYRRAVRRRPPSQSWRTFLRNHAPHIWAADALHLGLLGPHARLSEEAGAAVGVIGDRLRWSLAPAADGAVPRPRRDNDSPCTARRTSGHGMADGMWQETRLQPRSASTERQPLPAVVQCRCLC